MLYTHTRAHTCSLYITLSIILFLCIYISHSYICIYLYTSFHPSRLTTSPMVSKISPYTYPPAWYPYYSYNTRLHAYYTTSIHLLIRYGIYTLYHIPTVYVFTIITIYILTIHVSICIYVRCLLDECCC